MKTLGLKPSAIFRVSVLLLVSAILLIFYSGGWLSFLGDRATTDNASVRGNITYVVPQVQGQIREVYIKDFQHVKKGDLLFNIDDSEYKIVLAKAVAERKRILSELKNSDNAISIATADIKSAENDKKSAEFEFVNEKNKYQRYSPLAEKGIVSRADFDTIKSEYNVSNVKVQSATTAIFRAEANLDYTIKSKESLRAQLEIADNSIARAQLDLNYTKIRAFDDGNVGEVYVNPGDKVAIGDSLTVLSTGSPWIIANFKESKLDLLRIGEKVFYEVDALPGKKFTGTIQQISPISLGETRALNASNAAGNFIKISQKFAVAITPDHSAAENLRPGMSVVVSLH
ncbi:HlyD family secretion protein [Erwinia sp. INIA-01]|uniref:HlyD family secretion protein n=1 Tax=Erwinia sp. INIA01 TaxID=2991500 RepID=UPI00222528F5|nr:HlyD family secretion protein [Erwinia sp. INIA01]MCW1874243.1 HlyD family secretion protein [Erwinia sp. INIA01]